MATDYKNPDWLCIHKRINHTCPECKPKVGPLSGDKPDVDLERALAFIKAQNFQDDADGDFLEDFERALAAEFRAVRRDEARFALHACESYRRSEYGPYGTAFVESEDVQSVMREIQERIDELEAT